MNEEDNKVTRITVDLSTTVKPIAISEEEALKKLEEDNKTQAQFKDDSIDTPPEEEEVATYKGRQLNDTQKIAITSMQDANENFNQESFEKANVTMDTQTPEERKKQTVIILSIIIGIILLILLIELPMIIKNFKY
ncbi:MAG: hypothetical protein K6E99_02755 [Bacilli bacterium]|nr:hypothetical protein [Bacilli bacterium]